MGEASINLHRLHTTSMHHNTPEGFQMSSMIRWSMFVILSRDGWIC